MLPTRPLAYRRRAEARTIGFEDLVLRYLSNIELALRNQARQLAAERPSVLAAECPGPTKFQSVDSKEPHWLCARKQAATPCESCPRRPDTTVRFAAFTPIETGVTEYRPVPLGEERSR